MPDEITYFDVAAFLADIEPDYERYLDPIEKKQRLVLVVPVGLPREPSAPNMLLALVRAGYVAESKLHGRKFRRRPYRRSHAKRHSGLVGGHYEVFV